MLVCNRLSNVDGGEHHENIGLNQRNAEMQSDKYDWEYEWKQHERNENQQIAREHVGKQTNRERKNAGEMGNRLDQASSAAQATRQAQQIA